ncbi:hypothetical protein [Geoglobus ahangari]
MARRTKLCDELSSTIVRTFCKEALQLARRSGGYFDPIKQDFLNLYYTHIESKRIDGELSPQEYRQKGNAFRDFISELIYIRSGRQYRLLNMKIQGYTERNHDVDLAFKKGNLVIVAGEVKMLGSPSHRVGGSIQKERKTQSDLDKRLKEVKFTAVDLKLHYTPDKAIVEVVQSIMKDMRVDKTSIDHVRNQWWDRWIKTSIPGFYSFWASRLASGELKDGRIVKADNPDLLLEKFENLKRYNNAVGVFFFKEDNGRYVPAEEKEIARRGLKIDDTIDELIKFLDDHLD